MKKGQTFAWILGSERTGVRLEAVKHIRRVSARTFDGSPGELKGNGGFEGGECYDVFGHMGSFCIARITFGYRHREYRLTLSLFTVHAFTIHTP